MEATPTEVTPSLEEIINQIVAESQGNEQGEEPEAVDNQQEESTEPKEESPAEETPQEQKSEPREETPQPTIQDLLRIIEQQNQTIAMATQKQAPEQQEPPRELTEEEQAIATLAKKLGLDKLIEENNSLKTQLNQVAQAEQQRQLQQQQRDAQLEAERNVEEFKKEYPQLKEEDVVAKHMELFGETISMIRDQAKLINESQMPQDAKEQMLQSLDAQLKVYTGKGSWDKTAQVLLAQSKVTKQPDPVIPTNGGLNANATKSISSRIKAGDIVSKDEIGDWILGSVNPSKK